MRSRGLAFILLLSFAAACADDSTSGREERLLRAARQGDLKTVSSLLDFGADIETANPGNGWTPLFWAAVKGNAPAIRLLLARGARIEARDTRGLTPLMAAARWGKTDGVAALLDGGARIGAVDQNGWNALMWAAFKGQSDMAAFLLDRGAALEARDPDGRTPLALATMKGHANTIELLAGRGAAVSRTTKASSDR